MAVLSFVAALPTFLEQWPAGLRALSIPQIELPLTAHDARALGSNIRGFGRWFSATGPLAVNDLACRLGAAVATFPTGAFVRLGSRSGKDSDFGRACGMRIHNARGALRMLTDGSARIAWDLRLALAARYPPHVFVRQWQHIPPAAEFRCFMSRRRLVGICQYDCVNLGACSEIIAGASQIVRAIQTFFPLLVEHIHLEDVVFDVFLEGWPALDEQPPLVRLLELNPFSPKTDGILFRWPDADAPASDFDGSFRYAVPNPAPGSDRTLGVASLT